MTAGMPSCTMFRATPHDTAVIVIVVCILLVCALLWYVLRLAHVIASRIGQTGLNIATRLLGLLLTAIAIQTMAEGLKGLFPGLSG